MADVSGTGCLLLAPSSLDSSYNPHAWLPSPDHCAKVTGGSRNCTLRSLVRDERSLLVVPSVLEGLGDSRQGNSTPLFPYAVPRPAGPPVSRPCPSLLLTPSSVPTLPEVDSSEPSGHWVCSPLQLLSSSWLARAGLFGRQSNERLQQWFSTCALSPL